LVVTGTMRYYSQNGDPIPCEGTYLGIKRVCTFTCLESYPGFLDARMLFHDRASSYQAYRIVPLLLWVRSCSTFPIGLITISDLLDGAVLPMRSVVQLCRGGLAHGHPFRKNPRYLGIIVFLGSRPSLPSVIGSDLPVGSKEFQNSPKQRARLRRRVKRCRVPNRRFGKITNRQDRSFGREGSLFSSQSVTAP